MFYYEWLLHVTIYWSMTFRCIFAVFLSDEICLLFYDVLTIVFLFDDICLLFFNALLLNFCLMTSVYCSIMFCLLFDDVCYCIFVWWRLSTDLYCFAIVIISDEVCLLFYEVLAIVYFFLGGGCYISSFYCYMKFCLLQFMLDDVCLLCYDVLAIVYLSDDVYLLFYDVLLL